MTTYILAIIAFLTSAVCGFIIIPRILSFCKRRNLYDIPNARKIHHNAIPRLGGLAFVPCMFFASVLALIVMTNDHGNKKIEVNLWTVYFIIGLTMVYIVGFIDDIIGVSPKSKFIIQIISACFLPFSWLYINNLYGFCGIYAIPFYVGAPLTVFVLVFIMNAMNLIDGIDGLCSSLTLLALGGFFYSFACEHIWSYIILIAGLMGVLVPYLYFNLFGDPTKNRKIFMGDSGSLSLGFILGVLLVKFTMNNMSVMPYRKDSLLVAITLMIIPTFDVVRVILVRIYHHKPMFVADKNHIHHKLMRAGFSQHKALVIILSLAVFFLLFNLFVGYFVVKNSTIILGLDIIIFVLFHYVVDKMISRHGNESFNE